MKNNNTTRTVIAISPTVRGFGYIIYEGVKNPRDWGKAEIRFQKNRRSLNRINKLLDFYEPDIVALEDSQSTRKGKRAQNLLMQVERCALIRGMDVKKFSHDQVNDVFSQCGAFTKFEIAKIIAEWYPELKLKLPEKRRLGWAEDEHYGIFAAAAIAITYYYIHD